MPVCNFAPAKTALPCPANRGILGPGKIDHVRGAIALMHSPHPRPFMIGADADAGFPAAYAQLKITM
jgi:hypothetical protein